MCTRAERDVFKSEFCDQKLEIAFPPGGFQGNIVVRRC